MKSFAFTLSLLLLSTLSKKASAQAGDGVAGLQQANKLVGSYFDYGVTLLYSIGAIVGLVGAVKVYNAWSHGDQQTNKLAASWFGACIFLVVVAALLKSFFGVS
jgi:hypothetical protein